MDYPIDNRRFVTPADLILIILAFYGAFNWPGFAGGFEWFLILGLSPRAWR